jgi:outer membrane protein assembly factor BamD
MKKCITLLAALSVVFCLNCAWLKSPDIEKPAQDLIRDGMHAFERGRYEEAINNFEQLKDWYPFSKYAILAELKIADAHYELKHYAEAVLAYEEFEQLHPRNEAVPYVIYQSGRCYYEQIDTIDRSQTPAKKAYTIFQRLVNQYPDDPYARRAQPHIIKCLQSLSGHDFYVGNFYLKTKQYKAALNRFMTVVTDYPDVGYHYRALHHIAQCEALVAAKEKIASEK